MSMKAPRPKRVSIPSTERKPIPETAKSAAALLAQRFQREVNDLASQTIRDMGLSADAGWAVNFDRGVVERQVPAKGSA